LLAPPVAVAGEPRFASFRAGRLVGLGTQPVVPSQVASGPAGLAVRNATFTYPGATEPALNDVRLQIPPGAFVAVTGPIGSGKSALARCLAGIYPLDSGEILVDSSAPTEVAPGRIGYSPQDGHLFSGSVRENVFLETGASSDPEALQELLRLAGMDDDVATMPRGTDTPIGEQGIRISGGQRQRLGLARAAAAGAPTRPGVLVLDDPFSAVDVHTESRIVANLRDTFGAHVPSDRRATVVLFSQRLAAFAQADLVVVLDRGRIVERGPHADLLANNGLYARIYRNQQRVDGLVTANGAFT
jgi:ABC-type multidrug transport system fused ATPase/permease subunit